MSRFFWPLWPKNILERKMKNVTFTSIKTTIFTLYIVPKIVLKFHKDISNDYRNINQISGLSSPKLGILHIKVHLL